MTVSGVPLQIINSKDKPILSSESITITTYTLVLTQHDFEKVVSASGIDQSRVYYVYETNLTGTKAQGKACADALEKRLSEISAADGCSYYVDSQAATEEQVHALYGSLFFIGIFLGIVFLLGTVLIIYYKQISEGYDDEVRFSVMRKVGMSDAEIRGTIHRQIVMVFFLPLLIAVIHILVAFRYMTQILKLMGLANTSLFLICTAICLLVFAVVYGVVYLLTARAYYRIVRH
jgi:putative ABC transport system permease protein